MNESVVMKAINGDATEIISPLRLLACLLIVLFFAEAIIMFMFSLFFNSPVNSAINFSDSLLLVLISAPFLWILIVRPLRKSAEAKAAWTSALLEHVVDGIVIFDDHGIVKSWNHAAEVIFDYPAPKVIGQHLNVLFFENEDNDERREHRYRKLVSPYENCRISHDDLGRRRDGSSFPMDISVSMVNFAGETAFIGIIRDYSERKQAEDALRESEERFRTLCDSAPIGIFLSDSEGNNIYCNPRWEGITRVSAAEGSGNGWSKAIHPADREELGKVWLEAFTTGRFFCHEHRQLTPQGKTIWVRALATPFKNAEGITLGHVGTLEDITELRQARQEMLKTQKLESLGLLAGGIAHDFNNILTAILGNISLARLQLHDLEKVTKRLEGAKNATIRAKDLANQLLTFARGGEPVKKIIDVCGLLRETADFALHGSNARCIFALAEDLWPVEADEGQLVQVVHNLLLNAAQAMPEGGTVTINANNDSSAQERKRSVNISITDTGTGISDQHLQRIFDPYFTTKQQGSGLGLATCYSIIKKHGGKICTSSSLGNGSTFTISLPASEQEIGSDLCSQTAILHGSGRVLVMDDEEIIQELAQVMLKELGYSVECVDNGSEALDLYLKRREQGTPFSIVILDLTIPGGAGGKEVIAHLLKVNPDVKAIVSSGYSSDPVMANFRQFGFSSVLCKPYGAQEMSNAIQELLML